MKLSRNRIARVFPRISNKPIYIKDWIRTADNKVLIYYQEYGDMAGNTKTKVLDSLKSPCSKRYTVTCLQGTNFMDWTHEEPMTAAQLRSHFWGFGDFRTEKFYQFTLNDIREVWEVAIDPVN